MTRTFGSPRCCSSQSVSTRAPGFVYSAMGFPFPFGPAAGRGIPIYPVGIRLPHAGPLVQVEPSDRGGSSEEPEGGLRLLRHHLRGPRRTKDHLRVHLRDPLDAGEELLYL